jgi:hypothetical protein
MLTWQQLISLLDYWNEYPPVHILLQGIAAGLGARFGNTKVQAPELPNKVQSAEELVGVLQGSGLPFGVIPHGR